MSAKPKALRRRRRRAMLARRRRFSTERFGTFTAPHCTITYYEIPRSTYHANGSQR